MPGKSKFFENVPGKIEIFQIFAWKIEIFLKLPEKIEISRKFAWKTRNFIDPDPWPTRLQNQIDAADIFTRYQREIRNCTNGQPLTNCNG